MRKYLQPLLVLLILGVATSWYASKQPQLKVADGKGWDGVTYHKMYQHFKGQPTDAEFYPPFNKRIGLPWLAAKLEMDATKAFRLINLSSGALAVVFVYLALRGLCSGVVMFACLAPMLCYVFSPIRFPNFYPFTVDPPAMMLYALAAYLLTKDSLIPAAIALALSTFFRESGVYFGVCLAMVMFYHGATPRWKAWLALALAIFAAAIAAKLQLPGPPHSQWGVIASGIKQRLIDPGELLRIVACISLTLAPFALFKFYGKKAEQEKPSGLLVDFAAAALFLSLAMGALGGSDTTRIFFICYPLFVFVLVDWLKDQDSVKVGITAAAGMVANRFRMVIPEPTASWPSHDVSGFFSFTPDHAHISISVATLAYWALLWFILFGPGWSHLQALSGQVITLTSKLRFR